MANLQTNFDIDPFDPSGLWPLQTWQLPQTTGFKWYKLKVCIESGLNFNESELHTVMTEAKQEKISEYISWEDKTENTYYYSGIKFGIESIKSQSLGLETWLGRVSLD